MWPLMIRKVTGDSMSPALPNGALVWGWKWFNTLKTGNIIIFKHNDKEKIKRLEKIEDSKLHVVGDNRAKSTDSRNFGLIETDSVVAKVIWPRV